MKKLMVMINFLLLMPWFPHFTYATSNYFSPFKIRTSIGISTMNWFQSPNRHIAFITMNWFQSPNGRITDLLNKISRSKGMDWLSSNFSVSEFIFHVNSIML